jgi:hypothetical protein
MDGGPVMTPETSAALAADLEGLILATAGVRSVYRSGSLISNLLRAGAAALGSQRDGDPVVAVMWRHGGVAVEASLGIDSGTPASQTLHAVQAAIDAFLSAAGLRRESITLGVAYVHSREAS